ncbi:unnamed protein product [Blepharisma stoltei]|uniref:Tubulin-tyrosine ligase family protein n=1 Tax=Blepharisma stoltei TaxID=1481888 RepID=A0AAU9IK87_9CILI|nr:unnamed protein product [Blepharisma stoltei]
MDQRSKRYFIIVLALLSIWSFSVLIAVSTLPSESSPSFRVEAIPFHGENSFSYPHPEPNSYCDDWKLSSQKTVWVDRRNAYSATKIESFGWDMLQSKKSGNALQFASISKPEYHNTRWAKIFLQSDQENNEALFLIPKNANFIFTRMYHYKNALSDNIQTARLGVDYACPGQILNHIPGASAFCRKDFLQRYLLDYNKRLQKEGLSHCFRGYLTPKSYILGEPDHCNAFIDELEAQLNNYNSSNMPIEWITKSSLRHKGYGIELIDYKRAQYYYNLYRKNEEEDLNCNRVLDAHKSLIAQKYISNPALIEGRKFDFRVFAMVINSDPLVALWAPENGHTRLSDQEFDKLSTNFTTHITANVANQNPDSVDFLKKYRFNLREIANYYKDQLKDHEKWLTDVAFPQVKQILIHMLRATQQNFLIKRIGFLEFYGIDFILDDTLQNIYLLESNRRPDVQEKNPDLQYREDMLLQDFSAVAEYFLKTGVSSINTEEIYKKLKAFKPLVDETRFDPYFGLLSEECRVTFKEFNEDLPIDPMIEPLKYYVGNFNAKAKV